MSTDQMEPRAAAVFGQKYAFATVSLVLGIASFVSLLGMEKAVLAIVYGWLALKAQPSPKLTQRSRWAKAGAALGAIQIVLLVTILIVNYDKIQHLVSVLETLAEGK